MSTPSIAASAEAISPRARTGHTRLPAWLREPLLHFILLGGVLFALNHVLNETGDDPRTIVMGADVDKEARDTFAATRGRQPNAEELAALRQVWLDNEVLYREGMALGVDKGDAMIRERVIFKALSIVDSNLKVPTIDDTALKSWFEGRRDKYDEPARFSFQEAVLAGDASESAVRGFVASLNAGTPADASAGLRVFKDRPGVTLAQSYGTDFAKELEESSPGEWRAVRTRDGWRAIRLDGMTPPKPALYEVLRPVIMQDWRDAKAAEIRTAAVRALGRKYHLRIGTPAQ